MQRRRAPAPAPAPALASRDLQSQVLPLGNGTRIALRTGYSTGQQTYSMPVLIADQEFNLQIDTGSADMWVASNRCRGDSCSGSTVKFLALNDQFQAADSSFAIQYLRGSASGPIYTANVTVGSHLIIKQAFASADTVVDESLSTGKFSGVIGLSLPANSLQQETLNLAEGNDNPLNDQEDPSFTGSPLPGLWSDAPSGSRFFGLGLQRIPEEGGSGDSVLTFGVHDSVYAPDPSKIAYQAVIEDADQVARHWRTTITEIGVSVGGNTTNTIQLSPSIVANVSSNGFPLAILDSGAPISLGPPDILNSMYGAFGINPASDGGYYMPCNTQLNITLTINGIVVPIHPLDASLHTSQADPNNCLGTFQAQRSLTSANLPADFILAAPVMRSMYSVFTCEGLNNPPPGQRGDCRPRIGLLPTVTNLTRAQDEFYRVRVLKQALGSSNDDGDTLFEDSGGLSSGVKVLIGTLSALALIVCLFLALLFLIKRRRRQEEEKRISGGGSGGSGGLKGGLKGSPAIGGDGTALHRPNTSGGRRSTGYASRRHLSDVSASAFGSSSRSRSKMYIGDEDDHLHHQMPSSGGPGAGDSPRDLSNGGHEDDDGAALALDPKYRALAQMHGVYLDEVDDHLMGPSPARDPRGPPVGPIGGAANESNGRLGVGHRGGFDVMSAESTGTYYEAKAIRNDYLRRHPSLSDVKNTTAGDGEGRPEGVKEGGESHGEGIPMMNLSSAGPGVGVGAAATAGAGADGSGRTRESTADSFRIPEDMHLRPLGLQQQPQYPSAATAQRGSPEPLLERELHGDERR
ncbi:hypothetical protein V8E36_005855 [Tilletia maclaganii]